MPGGVKFPSEKQTFARHSPAAQLQVAEEAQDTVGVRVIERRVRPRILLRADEQARGGVLTHDPEHEAREPIRRPGRPLNLRQSSCWPPSMS